MTYDSGGYLPQGLTVVTNSTSSPERILTRREWEEIARDE